MYDALGKEELVDAASSFTPQKLSLLKLAAPTALFLVRNCKVLHVTPWLKNEVSIRSIPRDFAQNQGLTAVEKIFNANALGIADGKVLHAGSDVRVKVNIVGSQDTTGLMTVQELESMAATVISPTVDGAYQSGCHTLLFGT